MAATIADLGARVLRRLGVAVVAAADRPALTALVSVDRIATRALQMLGVVASDETPAAADMEIAREQVAMVHDALVGAGCRVLVDQRHPACRRGRIHPPGGDASGADLRQAGGPGHPGRDRGASAPGGVQLLNAPAVAEQAVMDVHANLDARGKTRWGAFDIPDYAEEPVVVLAANRCAPAFGLPVDPAADVRAMRDLAQVIALGAGPEPIRAEYF
jgi:hypothetical protein